MRRYTAVPFLLALFPCVALAQNLVRDINPGSAAHSNPQYLTASGGYVYFLADDGVHGREVWWTDGNQAGICADIRSGTASSNPEGFYPFLGGVIVFANDGVNGQEMYWIQRAVTVMIDITPGPSSTGFGFGTVNGVLFFVRAYTQAYGNEMWATDGGTAWLVRDLMPGPGDGMPSYGGLAVISGRVLFNGTTTQHGTELWSTDGSFGGTFLIKDVAPGSASGLGNGTPLVSDGLHTFFSGYEPATGNELWFSDGSTTGTVLVHDLVPGTGGGTPQPVVFLDQRLYLLAQTPATGRELFSVARNGSGQLTLLADLTQGAASTQFSGVMATGDLLFFQTGNPSQGTFQLLRSDGTAAGTFGIRPGGTPPTHGGGLFPVGVGTRILFRGNEYATTGEEPWVSNGTLGGTARLMDLAPGAAGSFPEGFSVVQDKVVFAATVAASGRELYSMPLVLTRGCIVETLMPGCPGPSGVPRLSGSGIPRFGNSAFALHLTNAPANTAAGFALSFTGNHGVGGCIPQVGQSASSTIVVTSSSGFASLPIAVPNNPTFLSLQLFAQAAVLQPGGGYLGIASLSNGLRIVVGDS